MMFWMEFPDGLFVNLPVEWCSEWMFCGLLVNLHSNDVLNGCSPDGFGNLPFKLCSGGFFFGNLPFKLCSDGFFWKFTFWIMFWRIFLEIYLLNYVLVMHCLEIYLLNNVLVDFFGNLPFKLCNMSTRT